MSMFQEVKLTPRKLTKGLFPDSVISKNKKGLYEVQSNLLGYQVILGRGRTTQQAWVNALKFLK